jgi:hypothetical protein
MTKKALLRRIEELERRVAALEARPQFFYPPISPPIPWYPLLPQCPSTGDPMPPWTTIISSTQDAWVRNTLGPLPGVEGR